ncbi:transposable element Tcb2 transposase [Trichonephila clavipes]|nr:transposable element Tcb2 transposase [Trichonephila clavipes]
MRDLFQFYECCLLLSKLCSLGEDKVNSMTLLYTDQDVLAQIDTAKIIDEFATEKSRRKVIQQSLEFKRRESRFNLSSDDNRVRVWRPRGERHNPAFDLQQHTFPTAGVMIWGVIAYNTRSPLVLIRGTMTAQKYVHGILQPHVLPLMQRLPGAIFQQDNSRPHTARVLQACLHGVTTLPWPARFPDLSPIEHIWDYLVWRIGHPTSLNELEDRLQQIWNEMSQDIIQNLYASMSDRIALCIRARGSTGY